MKPAFQRRIEITPAFDRRDPDPRKDYGIHCCDLRMVLIGEKGAVQFVLYTNWYLPEIEQPPLYPNPADLGYHSLTPRYEGQTRRECDLLPGGFCYYDGSGLNAEPIYQTLLTEGSEGVWKALESYYAEPLRGSMSQPPVIQGRRGGAERRRVCSSCHRSTPSWDGSPCEFCDNFVCTACADPRAISWLCPTCQQVLHSPKPQAENRK